MCPVQSCAIVSRCPALSFTVWRALFSVCCSLSLSLARALALSLARFLSHTPSLWRALSSLARALSLARAHSRSGARCLSPRVRAVCGALFLRALCRALSLSLSRARFISGAHPRSCSLARNLSHTLPLPLSRALSLARVFSLSRALSLCCAFAPARATSLARSLSRRR